MLYECVDEYLESEYKIEQLSDPNKITFPQRTLNLISFNLKNFIDIPSFQKFVQKATKPKRSQIKGAFRRGFYFVWL